MQQTFVSTRLHDAEGTMEVHMASNIRTLDSVIHAKFVSVEVVEKQDDGSATLRVTPTNDPEADPIAVHVSKTRVEELGFASAA